jgi:hypothetical protein
MPTASGAANRFVACACFLLSYTIGHVVWIVSRAVYRMADVDVGAINTTGALELFVVPIVGLLYTLGFAAAILLLPRVARAHAARLFALSALAGLLLLSGLPLMDVIDRNSTDSVWYWVSVFFGLICLSAIPSAVLLRVALGTGVLARRHLD